MIDQNTQESNTENKKQINFDKKFFEEHILSKGRRFNIIDAMAFGSDEAILIERFKMMLNLNVKHPEDFKEGKVWTYDKYEDIQKWFPFWSIDKLKGMIRKLIKNGVLLKRQFRGTDRRNSYTLSDKYGEMRENSIKTTMMQICTFQGGESPPSTL